MLVDLLIYLVNVTLVPSLLLAHILVEFQFISEGAKSSRCEAVMFTLRFEANCPLRYFRHCAAVRAGTLGRKNPVRR